MGHGFPEQGTSHLKLFLADQTPAYIHGLTAVVAQNVTEFIAEEDILLDAHTTEVEVGRRNDIAHALFDLQTRHPELYEKAMEVRRASWLPQTIKPGYDATGTQG